VAFLIMGLACIANARRCGRVHCYFTGPLFLLSAVLSAVHGWNVIDRSRLRLVLRTRGPVGEVLPQGRLVRFLQPLDHLTNRLHLQLRLLMRDVVPAGLDADEATSGNAGQPFLEDGRLGPEFASPTAGRSSRAQ